jgi:hypothetical protein
MISRPNSSDRARLAADEEGIDGFETAAAKPGEGPIRCDRSTVVGR